MLFKSYSLGEWGELSFFKKDECCLLENQPRSYDFYGNQMIWHPKRLSNKCAYACDVEDIRYPVSPFLMKKFDQKNTQLFLENWTQTEVLAKLRQVPILIWLKKYGLCPGSLNQNRVRVKSFFIQNKVIALGIEAI